MSILEGRLDMTVAWKYVSEGREEVCAEWLPVVRNETPPQTPLELETSPVSLLRLPLANNPRTIHQMQTHVDGLVDGQSGYEQRAHSRRQPCTRQIVTNDHCRLQTFDRRICYIVALDQG